MCGMPSRRLAIYISRRKVIVENEMIDSDNETNALFYNKHNKGEVIIEKKEPKIVKEKKTKPIKEVPLKIKKITETPKVKKVPKEKALPPEQFKKESVLIEKSDGVMTLTEIEKEKKLLEVEKLKSDARLSRLKAEKMEGFLIPTDLVKAVIRELSEAMKISYYEAIETYTVIVGAQVKLDNTQITKIKSHFTTIINDTLVKQVQISKKMINNIVAEYSETRGKGERM